MKIFGIEIRRSRITDEILTELPEPDDQPVVKAKKAAALPLQYHLGQLYARIEAAEAQIDTNRRDIAATQKATYRRPPIKEAEELFNRKNNEKPVESHRTGDPWPIT